MNSILLIGSLNMDMVIEAPKLPVIGESLIGSGFMTTPGGKGANQAIAIARLGGAVNMIGCVGDDSFGKRLYDNLKNNHVGTHMIKTMENTSTGVAVITLVNGDNCIIVDTGANNQVLPENFEGFEDVIKESDLVVLQMEIPFETILEVVKLAAKHGTKILFNPAPAKQLPDNLLSQIDILTPNESECEIITGMSISSIDDAKNAALYLMNKGVKQVVITMGKRGVVYNDGTAIAHKEPPVVKAVDTTAAGDSFTAALAVKLSKGAQINEAIEFASYVGALTVTKKGAQESLPTLSEVEAFRKSLL